MHKMHQTWILESVVTFHVAPQHEWFLDYSAKADSSVQLNNGQECQIVGIVEIPIRCRMEVRSPCTMFGIYPRLVSIGMLAEDGYRTTLHESTWVISRGNLKIGSGYKYNNLYPLMVINPEGAVNVAEKTDPNLWHGRLGHMSQAGLNQLMAVGYIPKLLTKMDFSEHC
mgnify:CR=1 FL=1